LRGEKRTPGAAVDIEDGHRSECISAIDSTNFGVKLSKIVEIVLNVSEIVANVIEILANVSEMVADYLEIVSNVSEIVFNIIENVSDVSEIVPNA